MKLLFWKTTKKNSTDNTDTTKTAREIRREKIKDAAVTSIRMPAQATYNVAKTSIMAPVHATEAARKQMKEKSLTDWLDKLSYFRIFLLWLSVVLFFTTIYFVTAINTDYLVYSNDRTPVQGISEILYFSVVTSTGTGYWEIMPIGPLKALSFIESLFGLVILAVITSKIVSMKQNVILGEVYDLSFSGRLNTLRSSLLLFRQNLSRLANRIEDGVAKKREIHDLTIYLASVEDVLTEAHSIFEKTDKSKFLKKIDPINTELIFNSVLTSFERLNELLMLMNNKKKEWRREPIMVKLERCIAANELLYTKLTPNRGLPKKAINDIITANDKTIASIRAEMTKIVEKDDNLKKYYDKHDDPNIPNVIEDLVKEIKADETAKTDELQKDADKDNLAPQA